MRVAWLHTHFHYWMGGTKFVLEVTRRLAERCDLEIFVEGSSPDVEARFAAARLRVNRFAGLTSTSVVYWLMFPVLMRKELRVLKKALGGFDAVVASMFPMNWLAARLQLPYVQYCYEPFAFFHDRYVIDHLRPSERAFVRLLSKAYSRYDLVGTREAGSVLTLNRATARGIRNVYGLDATPTYMGVDIGFYSKKEVAWLSERYRGRRVVFHSTDFTPIKAPELAVKGLASLVRECPEALLLVSSTVQSPSKKAALLRLAERLDVADHLEFLGFVDHDLLPAYYSLADAVWYLGQSRGTGASSASLVVLEAMACETPVVRANDTDEEVVDGESGYLVDPLDPEQVAGATLRLLRNPDAAREMGRKGRAMVERRYSWDLVAERVWNAVQNEEERHRRAAHNSEAAGVGGTPTP